MRKLSTEAAPRLQTSVILTRSPTLSHTPTPFESAYYAYQARLARTLSSPFPSEFYFKKGSLLERKFNAEERAREAATFGEDFGGLEGEERVEDVPSEEDEVVVLPRESEADRTGDVKSLNRRGERNLYLLVKDTASGEWRFPQGDANLEQPLHDVRLFPIMLVTYGRANGWAIFVSKYHRRQKMNYTRSAGQTWIRG